jgi:hypothetical protein
MTPTTHHWSPTGRGPKLVTTEPRDIRAGAYAPALHDRVRIPDGRAGEVIGFYRRTAESALVQLESGESIEVLVTDVQQQS